MLDQVAAHGGFSLILSCEGDSRSTPITAIEDCAIAFGRRWPKALGDRRGIGRFGFSLPMDEAEAQVLIDLSRPPLQPLRGRIRGQPYRRLSDRDDRPQSSARFADSLGAAIHVRVDGENDHHKTEACFKAFGRALRQAIAREGERGGAEHERRAVKLAIVDLGYGNIGSVGIALRAARRRAVVTADPDAIAAAERVVLPGVGAAGHAMARIDALGPARAR